MSPKLSNFDTEKFIIEIQSRPSIWDSSSQDYSNRDLKKKCWQEVVETFGGEVLNIGEKKDLGLELQKRWKGLRSCFARELKRIKNIKSGSGVNIRKTEYIYYNQLQFLKKVVAIRESEEEEEDNLEGNDNEEGERPKIGKRKRQTAEDDDPFIRALNNYIEQRRRETEEMDEDKLFLLSLLSTLKGLPSHIKMRTKVNMLNLLSEASGYSSDMP